MNIKEKKDKGMKMIKVVYNAANTGLFMSEKCLERYLLKKKAKGEIKEYRIEWQRSYARIIENDREFYSYDIPRHDMDLIACVEELGAFEASIGWSELRIVEVDCDKYTIIEYRLRESIETEDTLNWISVTD